MQDLIDAAVERGRERYELEQRKKVPTEKTLNVLARQWVTEELPDKVTEVVSKDLECKEFLLKSIYYKNKCIADSLLYFACDDLGLKTRIETGRASYYEDGPPEDYTSYYVIF